MFLFHHPFSTRIDYSSSYLLACYAVFGSKFHHFFAIWKKIKNKNYQNISFNYTFCGHTYIYVLQTLAGKIIPHLLTANERLNKRKSIIAFFVFWITLRVHFAEQKTTELKIANGETYAEIVKSKIAKWYFSLENWRHRYLGFFFQLLFSEWTYYESFSLTLCSS